MKKLLTLLIGLFVFAGLGAQEKQPSSPPKGLKPPVITVSGKEADSFYKRNPTVESISRQGNIITLKMKDNTTKKYDLNNKKEEQDFKTKYGKSPIPTPPQKGKYKVT